MLSIKRNLFIIFILLSPWMLAHWCAALWWDGIRNDKKNTMRNLTGMRWDIKRTELKMRQTTTEKKRCYLYYLNRFQHLSNLSTLIFGNLFCSLFYAHFYTASTVFLLSSHSLFMSTGFFLLVFTNCKRIEI